MMVNNEKTGRESGTQGLALQGHRLSHGVCLFKPSDLNQHDRSSNEESGSSP